MICIFSLLVGAVSCGVFSFSLLMKACKIAISFVSVLRLMLVK